MSARRQPQLVNAVARDGAPSAVWAPIFHERIHRVELGVRLPDGVRLLVVLALEFLEEAVHGAARRVPRPVEHAHDRDEHDDRNRNAQNLAPLGASGVIRRRIQQGHAFILVDCWRQGPSCPAGRGKNAGPGPRNSERRALAGERLSGRGETGWLARTQGGREPQRGSMPREDSRPTEGNARRPVSPRPAPQAGYWELHAGVAPFAPRAKQARMVADNPPQAGRPAPGKEKGAAPAGWGSRGASVPASTLAERKRVARRSRAGSRASQSTPAATERVALNPIAIGGGTPVPIESAGWAAGAILAGLALDGAGRQERAAGE